MQLPSVVLFTPLIDQALNEPGDWIAQIKGMVGIPRLIPTYIGEVSLLGMIQKNHWMHRHWGPRHIPASLYRQGPKRTIEGPGGAAAGVVETTLWCQVPCMVMFIT